MPYIVHPNDPARVYNTNQREFEDLRNLWADDRDLLLDRLAEDFLAMPMRQVPPGTPVQYFPDSRTEDLHMQVRRQDDGAEATRQPRDPVQARLDRDHPLEDFLKATTKKKPETKAPALTFPIIAETNPDGTKKLYKTRYGELERMYATLHQKFTDASAALRTANDEVKKLNQNVWEHAVKIRSLEAMTVDGKKVDKMLKRVANELGVPIQEDAYGVVPLENKIETLLGTILCRCRTEVVQDEMAD